MIETFEVEDNYRSFSIISSCWHPIYWTLVISSLPLLLTSVIWLEPESELPGTMTPRALLYRNSNLRKYLGNGMAYPHIRLICPINTSWKFKQNTRAISIARTNDAFFLIISSIA